MGRRNVDISPFTVKVMDNEIVLYLKPSSITHPFRNFVGAVSYEIRNGNQLVVLTGIVKKREVSIDLDCIAKIDVCSKSFLRQLITFGSKDITFYSASGDKLVWEDVSHPAKVKALVDTLKYKGRECLESIPEYILAKDINLSVVLEHNASLYKLVTEGKCPKETYWPLYKLHYEKMKVATDNKSYVREMVEISKKLSDQRVAGVLMTVCTDLAQNYCDDDDFFRWTINEYNDFRESID